MASTRAHNPKVETNKLFPEDRPVHDWYRFVLSYPPHLVRDYLNRFGVSGDSCVLDPFCGTGTTLVECKKLGITSVGVEANPAAYFASSVKLDWSPSPDGLICSAEQIADEALAIFDKEGLVDAPLPLLYPPGNDRGRTLTELKTLPETRQALLLSNSISPLPLHKTLTLLENIKRSAPVEYRRHQLLAAMKTIVFSISNLHFGPEVGVSRAKEDTEVIGPWLHEVYKMASHLRQIQSQYQAPAIVHRDDARQLSEVVKPRIIDTVITSPPYPNEKDYTRTTRLESVLLGFLKDKDSLRALKKNLVRSNTRGVYKDDDDDRWIENFPSIAAIADAIEARRIELGKTSGFERMYARVTKLYFGGMARHLKRLSSHLRPGAQLAYVVGDQASYLRIMIRTGQLLAEIAESLGYEVQSIDLFRTRLATATKEQLREEVVVLRWPGYKS